MAGAVLTTVRALVVLMYIIVTVAGITLVVVELVLPVVVLLFGYVGLGLSFGCLVGSFVGGVTAQDDDFSVGVKSYMATSVVVCNYC